MRVRWLGRVPYREALALQQALFEHGREQHLLLLEHPHVFTHGPRADLVANMLVDPAAVGAELVGVKRGGDVTYHGPGQLVGYPIVNVPNSLGAADHVAAIQQLVIDVLADLGIQGHVEPEYPGVWVGRDNPRKICAIGVRLANGRTMHGFALNVDPDMRYLRDYIVPCGIAGKPVTSLVEEGVNADMAHVVDLVVRHSAERWGGADHLVERQDIARVEIPEGLSISARKPEWLRTRVQLGEQVMALKHTVREHSLVTVCEEAGCPNLSECWAQGTATFMVLGERCTRACGFCLIDTRKPGPPDAGEPARVASAVAQMELDHAVLTMVARDDLPDGGFAHVAACVRAIRDARVGTMVETLVSDAKGDAASIEVLLAARPDVFNHNMETVARLQRRVRPSAGYARSLGVLSLAKAAGLTTKSGFMLGLGETAAEVEGLLADLAAIGTNIVTIGQYLRPTAQHLPVTRWAEPEEFEHWALVGQALGIGHVEASPLTRSSYHAKTAAQSVQVVQLSERAITRRVSAR
jgi:lipoic acid synthetase